MGVAGLVAAAWLIGLAAVARAQDAGGAPEPPPPPAAPVATASALQLSIGGGVASDYVFRGVDLTGGGVQGLGGADAAWRDLYAGVWASNARTGAFGIGRADAEVDLYGGWRPSVLGYNLDLGVEHHAYAGARGDPAFTELYAKASRPIGPFTPGAAVYVSPDYGGRAGAGYYAEASAVYALTRRLTLSALLGHQLLSGAETVAPGRSGDFAYTTWTLGGSYAITDQITADLRYTDNDHRPTGGDGLDCGAYGAKVVARVRVTLP